MFALPKFSRTLASMGIVAVALLSGAQAQAPPVATGDTRTVTEPSFPAACQVLSASFHDANEDVPLAVEAVSTELDQARLQAALTACANTGQAVELAMDSSGNNAFLTGPISIPSGVTLLVDPGVTLYFSRNAQDYDTTPGVHTCGTVSGASNTGSCQNLISLNTVSNSGIMGYGKLNGRGGDVVLNSFPTAGYEGSTTGKTWWDLANDANVVGGGQQNPRGIQISHGTNITFYKITFKNSPNFHVAVNFVNGFTVWGMHIVTPYSARNTDGIDPGNATNVTITQSWISDGDDNIALGANAGPTSNVSVIQNKFFAGHGESIGSLTNFGVNNALYDSNAMYGDADVDGSNSTAIRIKSANDRGGLVQNIQYSNSCFANHGTQIQFTPIYNTNAGTLTPNFKNILLQNLRFSSQGPVATGSFTFLGASNNGVINPLQVRLDNVTVDTVAASNLVALTNAQITLGPGQVSSNLVSLLTPYNGVNGNLIIDQRTAPALVPPACTFTFLSPSLTGPNGLSQTVANGQFPTAVVILEPAFALAQYPYPTGTVTLTDEASRTFTATLSGSGDTTFIPITNAPSGTHTYTASYSGDSTYPAIASFGSYTVTVTGGSLPSTSTTLTGVPASTTYGTSFTAAAHLSGSASPSGSVNFLVNGAIFATVPVVSGTASYTFSPGIGSYTISALYAGNSSNAGSISTAASVTVSGAPTSIMLQSSATSGVVGTPLTLTATVASAAGTPTGTVTFSYTSASSSTPTILGNGTLTAGVATYAASLPQGTDKVTATYAASGNFAGSSSSPALSITISATPPVPASTAPIALPYTISTLVGGGSSNATCTGHVDTFGDGCQGSAVVLPSGTDLRSVTGDPFGAVYFTDSNSSLVRKVSAAGVVTQFAGYITGTACVPTATAGCTPTLVKLGGKPRGIYSDPFGNLFIAGYGDNKVYEVRAADGKMYLVAGSGTAPTNTTDPAGDGGPAATALLKGPRAIATDAAGNVYIADSGDNRIREVLSSGLALPGTANIQTVAGSGTAASTGDGALAISATLNNPQGVAVDSSGNLYIAEGSHVRAVCVNCTPGAGLYTLLIKLGIATPTNGFIYSIAGTSSSSNSTLAPGLGTTVSMAPQKLALDPDGNLYIADSANNVVWFEDGRTGYTRVLVGGGTATSCLASPIGDNCPATQAIIGSNGGNGIGVGFDSLGNLYVADSTNLRIRKVSTNLTFPANAIIGLSQTVKLHSQPGDTFTSVAVPLADFNISSVITSVCVLNPDTTSDCTYDLTFHSFVAGPRVAPLTIRTSAGNNGTLALAGANIAAAATLDPAAQLFFGQNLSPNAIAIDFAGSVLVADATSKSVLRFAPGAVTAGAAAPYTSLGSFISPLSVAADSLGNTFVGDAATGLISKIPAFGPTTILPTAFTAPQALATDYFNDLYVLDSTTGNITEIAANGLATRIIPTGLTAPKSLTLDASGNLFVTGDPYIERIDAQTLAQTPATYNTFQSSSALATDFAGNLFVADSGTGSLVAVPASAYSGAFTLATNLPASTLAIDTSGNLYTTSGTGQIIKLLRTQAVATYTGATSAASTVNLLSSGNALLHLALSDPDTTNFQLAFSSLNSYTGCVDTAGTISAPPGTGCLFTSSFTPSAHTNYTNTVSFTGNAFNTNLANPTPLTLTQIGNNAPLPVSVFLTGTSPANPSTSDSIFLTVRVSATSGTPSGTVIFAVDGTPNTPVTLTAGAAYLNIGMLAAGTHTVSAVFTSSDPTYASGSATPAPLTVTLGVVQLVTTTTFSKFPDGSYQAAVTVTNSGTATASAVTVTGLSVGNASGSPLPVNLGAIAPNAVATYTFAVPASAGASGSTVVERLTGTYTGGTFGGSLRARLP